jgi:hypothetical protein
MSKLLKIIVTIASLNVREWHSITSRDGRVSQLVRISVESMLVQERGLPFPGLRIPGTAVALVASNEWFLE